MNNEKFQVELPAEFLPYLHCLPGANLKEKLRIVLAMDLFMAVITDLEGAIQLSGQSAAHFNELFRSLTHLVVRAVTK